MLEISYELADSWHESAKDIYLFIYLFFFFFEKKKNQKLSLLL